MHASCHTLVKMFAATATGMHQHKAQCAHGRLQWSGGPPLGPVLQDLSSTLVKLT